MKKVIEFLFGKRQNTSTFLRIIYNVAVAFYFFSLLLLLLQAFDSGMIAPLLIGAFTFPIMFRLIYYLLLVSNQKERNRSKKVLVLFSIGIGISVIVSAIIMFVALNGENLAINTNKVTTNNKVELAIGKLKGAYEVTSFDITSSGVMTIPYEVNCKEGSLSIIVKSSTSNEVVWEDIVNNKNSGTIEFIGEEDTYTVFLKTKEAKNISLKISL